MRKSAAAVVMVLVVAACGGDDTTPATEAPPETSAPTTTAPAPETTTPQTSTSEATTTTTAPLAEGPSPLVIASVDFEAGVIVIRNDGTVDYDLTGHWVCNRPTYAPLRELVLAPGETAEISTISIGANPSSGEIGIYTSGSFGDPGSIIRYVQWGSDSHGRTSVAVSAGVWTEGDFVGNAGFGFSSSGSDPISATDWTSG